MMIIYKKRKVVPNLAQKGREGLRVAAREAKQFWMRTTRGKQAKRRMQRWTSSWGKTRNTSRHRPKLRTDSSTTS